MRPFEEKGHDEISWFHVGQSLTKKVKVDQKVKGLTKNSQWYDCTVIGLAVWEKYCENYLFGQDNKNKLWDHPRKIKHNI